jgi:two-component system sensor histidine kinase KdpD
VGERANGDGTEGPAGSGTDLALLEGYARQLGAAIEDATRYGAAAQRAEELDRLSRLQADFLRGVSHSLQTPLTKILALSEDLIDAPAEDGFVRERARVVQAEARRLARLVGQVLTLSRLEAGAYRPEEELCALLPLARRVWAGLGDGRRLVVEDVSAGALAVADRSAVEQILWVLFDNAMRYAPEGPVGFGLALETAPQVDGQARGAWLRARVMDRGPGVPEPERERIFGRFERGTSGEGQPGTGLGLGVARGLAEALRGQLDHEPRPGGGSIFTLSLPAEVPVAET